MWLSPAFVIERARVQANLAVLRAVKEAADLQLLLALKGFALPAILPDLLAVADGVAASSLNEVLLASSLTHKPIHLFAPAYRPSEVPELAARVGHWVFNSLSAYARWVDHLPPSVEIGLRVNPHYGFAGAPIYNPGRPGSRLGVPPSACGEPLPPRITGLHVHTLCEAGPEPLEALLQALLTQFSPWLPQVKWLNLGGGHLLTRADYDRARFVEAIHRLRRRLPNLETVYIEPSAAFVWEAGYLVAEVLDITQTEGRTWALLDVSFTAHMPDTLEMPYKPLVREAFPEPDPRYPTYWLGGSTCLAGDEMGPYSFPQPLEVGQRLTFHDMAHYTFVKTTFFNGVAHPALIVQEPQGYRIVKVFGFEDYRRRLSE